MFTLFSTKTLIQSFLTHFHIKLILIYLKQLSMTELQWIFSGNMPSLFQKLNGINRTSNLCFIELMRKRLIQLNTLNVLRSENFDKSLSSMFSAVYVVARISLRFTFCLLRPLRLSLEPFVTFSHRLLLSIFISQPLLPKSAGFLS